MSNPTENRFQAAQASGESLCVLVGLFYDRKDAQAAQATLMGAIEDEMLARMPSDGSGLPYAFQAELSPKFPLDSGKTGYLLYLIYRSAPGVRPIELLEVENKIMTRAFLRASCPDDDKREEDVDQLLAGEVTGYDVEGNELDLSEKKPGH